MVNHLWACLYVLCEPKFNPNPSRDQDNAIIFCFQRRSWDANMSKIKGMVKELQKEHNPTLHRKKSSKSTGGDEGKNLSNKEAPSAGSTGSTKLTGKSGMGKLSKDDIKYSKTLALGECSLANEALENTH